jgi:hypothetical protein
MPYSKFELLLNFPLLLFTWWRYCLAANVAIAVAVAIAGAAVALWWSCLGMELVEVKHLEVMKSRV